jgi:phage-related protein
LVHSGLWLSVRGFACKIATWPIGRPHCAPLGKGLWEVRSALDSNRIARVIFCMGDGYMILLHGFIKKTQKTPQADIDFALKRKREVT